MSGRIVQRLPDLVIPSTASLSNVIELIMHGTVDLLIYADAAFTGTITLQFAPIPNIGSAIVAGDYKALQYPVGTDFVIPAGKVVIVPAAAFAGIRLSSSGAEAAIRTCKVMLQEQVGPQDD